MDQLKSVQRVPVREPILASCSTASGARTKPPKDQMLQSSVGPSVPPSKRRADVPQFESADIGTLFPLKKPAGAVLKKARLEDTVYKDYPADVNGWGKFYLPKTVTMEVVGEVEGISSLCDKLVLMTCEDQRVYAYDEEELHLVASSFKQLLSEGMEYPGSKTYYKGEAFKDMTKKDWDEVRNSPAGRRLDEEHKTFVAERKPRLLDFMKSNQILKDC